MIDPIELHGLADGELTPAREAEIRLLLADCSASQNELQTIVALKTALREKTPSTECREQWTACVGRIQELDRSRKVERLVSGRFAWGLCGALFVTIVIAGINHRGAHDPSQPSADLARVVASLGPSKPVAPASPKEKALDDQLDRMFKEAKVSIDPNRMTITSRAYGELDGHPIQRITLLDSSGDLALVVLSDVLKLDGLGQMPKDNKLKVGHLQNTNCVAWTDGQNTLVLVANRSYEDLATVATRISFH